MARAKSKAPAREEIDDLVRRYRRSKDTSVRNHIISQHLYLVQTVARKFAGLGESHDDLLQEGAMGLINAVELYDPSRGVQFSTYATHLVEGQIRHYLRDKGKLIKQPAWVQELTTKIVKASDALTQELDRPPTLEEISQRVGVRPEAIEKMLDARERSKVASLDAVRGDDDTQAPAVDPEKVAAEGPDDSHLPIEDRIFLREAISRLKTLERKVVHHFYYLDLNQTEIARKLGISVNYASYLLRGAIAKLKRSFEAQEQAAMAASASDGTPSEGDAYSISFRPAPTDPLTKLATHAYFLDRLTQELARARRYPQQFSLLLIAPDQKLPDPDLSALARLLHTSVRSIDLVARLTGDRFGLLLPHTGREASVLADRLVHTVASRLKRGAGSQPATDAAGEVEPSQLPITVAIGFAVYPTNGRSPEAIWESAEEALREAHQQGGNRYLRGAAAVNNGPAPATA